MVSKRRQTDNSDDLVAILGSLPEAAGSAAEVSDEASRTVNLPAARRERREARNARRSRRHLDRKNDSEEGYSTDSSLPAPDADDFATAIDGLNERRNGILADVKAEEYRDPSIGLGKWFGEWRERFNDIYVGAW